MQPDDKSSNLTRERLEWLLTHCTDDWEIGEDVAVVGFAGSTSASLSTWKAEA